VITVAAGFIGVSWLAWAGVAAVVSALFTVIQIPEQTPHTTGLTHFVLRWAHSITWLLLGLSFLIRGLAPDLSTLADAVGLTALGAYIAFRTAISKTGRRHRMRLTDMTINWTVSTTQSQRILGVLASIAAGAALPSGAGTP